LSLIDLHLRTLNFCSDSCIFALISKKIHRCRDGYLKNRPLPRRTAMVICKKLPLPHRYRRGSGGAAAVAVAAAPSWTSLFSH
jgi:hypothetical protein